jgi:hypothetical protein
VLVMNKRTFLAFCCLLGTISISFADPIKKETNKSDTLAKECFDAFWKAVSDSKTEDAIKLVDTPFREPDGKKADSTQKLEEELNRLAKAPQKPEVKEIGIFDLKQFADYLKKNELKELTENDQKEYENFLGKDGKIVIFEIALHGEKAPIEKKKMPFHMLVRIKDNKAKLVGFGGGPKSDN